MLTRIIIVAVFQFQFLANGNLGRADTTVDFPAKAIGMLYCAPSAKVYVEAHVPAIQVELAYVGR